MNFQLKKNKLYLGLVIILAISSLSLSNPVSETYLILRRLFDKNKEIKSIKMTITSNERMDNGFLKKHADFKIIINPRKIYLKQKYPKEGLEVLYQEGYNDNKAFVNTNGFPWKTLSLDPLCHFMRNGNHHSIFKSGFTFLISVLEHLHGKYHTKFSEIAIYHGLVTFNNQSCHKISLEMIDFKFVDYTIQQNENLEDLSFKLKINDYMVYNLNDNIESFDEIDAGLKIKVPSDYARKFILFISNTNEILAGIQIFDDEGIYEEYTYSNIVINPSFTKTDFDENNPNYGF